MLLVSTEGMRLVSALFARLCVLAVAAFVIYFMLSVQVSKYALLVAF
jgi:hypothetical protein